VNHHHFQWLHDSALSFQTNGTNKAQAGYHKINLMIGHGMMPMDVGQGNMHCKMMDNEMA